ncbi:MAG TPA: DMT family transporter [Mariprofundaceae bacterium]|nr:DMT family transporter [Mariprofundaceae bacterium]
MSATGRAWILWALLSAASFAVMGGCVRVASEALPQSEVVFFRNFLALLFLMPLLWNQGVSLRTDVFGLHLARSGLGLTAMYLYFYALVHLPLASAMLLNYTSPLFIAVIAVLWLKERWTRPRIMALLLGFAGVLLLFNPGSEVASLAGLLGLASGAFAGLALATVKKLSASEPAVRIVTWFALLSSLISAVPMLFEFRWPTAELWAWLAAVGLFANLGQLGLTIAYSKAAATQVSPLSYSSLIFAGIVGFLAWGELPDTLGLFGTILVALAGIMVARERSEPLPVPPSTVPAVNPQESKL